MAISLSIKKLKNREYVYIVESYRDPATKRPTSRTLASFGRLDKLLAEDPDALKKIEEQVKELQSNSKAYSNTIKERMLSGVSVSAEATKARPVFVWTDEHIRGHFVLNYIGLVMQKIFTKRLREKGLDLSGAEIIEALESMKIQHVSGLKKANSHLYTCSNLEVEAASATDENGQKKTLGALCDEILRACDMEPLNAVETASTIRTKLRLKLSMK